MPIPLTRAGGQWHFDTAAGKDRSLTGTSGRTNSTPSAFAGLCDSATTIRRHGSGRAFRPEIQEQPGKKDGLYWEATGSEAASPFGPLVAEAHLEGYVNHNGSGSHPFHGYYFRILTRQGQDAAGGKMNYISHGNMTEDSRWWLTPKNGTSQHHDIYRQSGWQSLSAHFGEKTCQIARAMKGYDPDSESTSCRIMAWPAPPLRGNGEHFCRHHVGESKRKEQLELL